MRHSYWKALTLAAGWILVTVPSVWADPIVINSVSDLENISNDPGGDYVLGGNIDASGFNFTPIPELLGVLDGNGYTINGLTINSSSGYGTGLFADNGGTIENLRLTNVNINSADSYVGGLVAFNYGAIANASVTGTMTGLGASGSYCSYCLLHAVGGLVGFNLGSISTSYTDASVAYYLSSADVDFGNTYGAVIYNAAGGLVGYNYEVPGYCEYYGSYCIYYPAYGGTIQQSYATGPVIGTGEYTYAGGLVGILTGGAYSIFQSYSAGPVSASFAGGLAGENGDLGYGATRALSSYWNSSVSGATDVGSGPPTGAVGLTTTQLQSGLPSGFSPSVFSSQPGVNNGYPCLLSVTPGCSGPINWTGNGDGISWDSGDNWDLSRAPQAGDTVNLVGSASVTYANTLGTLKSLLVDGGMTLNLGAGNLNATNETIGDAASGVMSQTGGAHTVTDSLILGNQASGYGQYDLSGGTLNVANETIGNAGQGLFTQASGSSHTVTSSLVLGSQANSSGQYYLNGGALNAANETIGDEGQGNFTQTGGFHTVIGDLILGNQASGIGTYSISGGSLTVDQTAGYSGDIVVGNNGQGQITISGSGVMTMTGSLTLGGQSGGNGAVTFNPNPGDAASLNIGNALIVGSAGTGTFTQGHGNINVFSLTTGSAANSNGTYTLVSGTLSTNIEIIGDVGAGTFQHNLTQIFASSGVIDASGTNTTGTLILGNAAQGSGEYDLNGGSLIAGNETIGNAGSGVLYQTGGTNSVSGAITVGATSGGRGTYTLTGGTLTAGGAQIGANGSFTQSGGSATVNGAATNGGTWAITAGSTLNQTGGFTNNSGGTFAVSGASVATLSGGPALNNAGATIHVTGSTVTFAGGLTNNGAYISDPSVNILDHMFVGATGYIQAGMGDLFKITGAGGFVNQSMMPTLWNTMGATLEFAGRGAQTLGLSDGTAFGWNQLVIDAGAIVDLAQGMTTLDDSFYVGDVLGAIIVGNTITNIIGSPGLNLFYQGLDDLPMSGRNYDLAGGGHLICTGAGCSVPEPGTIGLVLMGAFSTALFRVRRAPGRAAHRRCGGQRISCRANTPHSIGDARIPGCAHRRESRVGATRQQPVKPTGKKQTDVEPEQYVGIVVAHCLILGPPRD